MLCDVDFFVFLENYKLYFISSKVREIPKLKSKSNYKSRLAFRYKLNY